MRLVSYTVDQPGTFGPLGKLGALLTLDGEQRLLPLAGLSNWAIRNVAPNELRERGIAAFAPPMTMLDLLDRGYGVTISGEPDLIPDFDPLADVRALLGLHADLAASDPTLARQLTIAAGMVRLLAPLPRPRSVRDFYAFEQHVRAARAQRSLEVAPEWYEMPVFYFSNHNAIIGPDQAVHGPIGSEELDYELEVACVIAKPGRDIAVEQAASYIAGYTIMNDWSARDLQRREMRVGLGPAKGKDFATSLGPMLVTPDELASREVGDGGYDLAMAARVNGEQRSRGNLKDIYYSFAQMIATASRDAWLYPGDVIGSGTVGTGCLLELTAGNGPYLQSGDIVELEVECLGMLRNPVT
jgi:fumarylacetoacetate (FAA) hydrolase